MGYQDKLKPVATTTQSSPKSYASKLKPVTAPAVEAPKEDGFLETLIKDPLKTLLIKPADRFAEAVGRTGILGKNIKTGYEEMSKNNESRTFGGVEVEPQKAFGDGGGKQILGDAAKSASYLYTGGTAPGAIKAGLGGAVKQGAVQGAKIGAVSGGLYGGGDAIQQEGSTIGSVAKGALGGAALGGATGGVLGAGTPLAVNTIANRATKRAKNVTDTVNRVLNAVDDKDREASRRVLSQLDTEDVKTYSDLSKRAEEKIDLLSGKMDEALDTDATVRKLNQLKSTTEVNGQEVSHNYVDDALNELEDYYKKTNAVEKQVAITQLRQKAMREGLTVREINDLARVHGKDLNAYNASGELASGLSKQGAENTRNGLKTTSRTLFGNKIAQDVDKEISDLIRVRTLADDMEKAVNKLQNKIMERKFGAKIMRAVVDVADLFTFGGLKGAFRSLAVPRGQGYQTFNALDLEKQLQKNLKFLNETLTSDIPEETVLKRLNEFIKGYPTKGNIKIKGVRAPGSVNIKNKGNEPYFPDSMLPTIR